MLEALVLIDSPVEFVLVAGVDSENPVIASSRNAGAELFGYAFTGGVEATSARARSLGKSGRGKVIVRVWGVSALAYVHSDSGARVSIATTQAIRTLADLNITTTRAPGRPQWLRLCWIGGEERVPPKEVENEFKLRATEIFRHFCEQDTTLLSAEVHRLLFSLFKVSEDYVPKKKASLLATLDHMKATAREMEASLRMHKDLADALMSSRANFFDSKTKIILVLVLTISFFLMYLTNVIIKQQQP